MLGTLRQIHAVFSCGGFRRLWVVMYGSAYRSLGGECTSDNADVLRNWRL